MTHGSDRDGDSETWPLEVAPGVLAAQLADQRPHVVLDVREAWELEICRLTACLHIPLGELAQRIAEVPRDRPVFVICHAGRRSLLATAFLRRAGLSQATNVQGGVEAWAELIDPGMPRY